MIRSALRQVREARRGVVLVAGVQLLSLGLVAGWFAAGHASAPDGGLHQIDVLHLSERVPGVTAVGGRPTMVVVTCPSLLDGRRSLDERYGFVVSTDPALARRLALPRAVDCQAGYVLLDGDSVVRYRSYDPGWLAHAFEQEVLLEAIAHGGHG
jgi:DNA-binding transcriptional LysR family regulator